VLLHIENGRFQHGILYPACAKNAISHAARLALLLCCREIPHAHARTVKLHSDAEREAYLFIPSHSAISRFYYFHNPGRLKLLKRSASPEEHPSSCRSFPRLSQRLGPNPQAQIILTISFPLNTNCGSKHSISLPRLYHHLPVRLRDLAINS
jgi:hypothetical protein